MAVVATELGALEEYGVGVSSIPVTSHKVPGDPLTDPNGVIPGELAKTAIAVHQMPSICRYDDVLLFAAYCPNGQLNQLQQEMIEYYKRAGYLVIAIINSGSFNPSVDPHAVAADGVIVRENHGFDFGAWGHTAKTISRLSLAHSVSITNDSIYPIAGTDGLRSLRHRVSSSSADIVFCTRNQEIRDHLQSYFVTFRYTALMRGVLNLLIDIQIMTNKEKLIFDIEIPFADRLNDGGYRLEVLFDLESAKQSGDNPTIHHWEELLDAGFPFWKIQLLTAGIVDSNDPRLAKRLGKQLVKALINHIEHRLAATENHEVDQLVLSRTQ